MQMSDAEIVRSYREAKDKRSQVGVLAELNACNKDLIREILKHNGINAPKPGRKSTTEPEPVKAALTEMAKKAVKKEPAEKSTEDDTPDELLLFAVERLKSLQEDREARERDIQTMQSIVDDYRKREAKLQEWLEKHKKGETS